MKLGVGIPFDHSYQNMGRPNSYVALDSGWAKAAGGPQKLFKMNTSAGGIRVPAFIKYPGDLSEGVVDSTFMTVMDLEPTFLDAAGAKRPKKYQGQPVLPMRGESIIPYLTGQRKTVHDTVRRCWQYIPAHLEYDQAAVPLEGCPRRIQPPTAQNSDRGSILLWAGSAIQPRHPWCGPHRRYR